MAEVLDGDSLIIQRAGQRVEVRLFGLDCPEHGQPFGNQAKRFTTRLVKGKTVRVVEREIDRYGRVVARVYLDNGRELSEEILRAGQAWWYERHAPDERRFRRAEAAARAEKIGLWADKNPLPPWEWRRLHPLP